MGKKVFNKDGSFTNPNRHRVRFYSKIFKKYYSVWIYKKSGLGSYITTKKPMLMMSDALMKQRMYGGKRKPLIIPKFDPSDYQWDVIIPKDL